jgi:hypothetical protein
VNKRSHFPAILQQAHDWVRRVVKPGDLAVDATAGNGHDTLFLAECVGPEGRVLALDVEPIALEETSCKLRTAGVANRVTLAQRGHEQITVMFQELGPAARPRAVMFNLGYRPGGDCEVLTRSETTIAGLNGALQVILPHGIISVVCYPGHEGGKVEANAVLAWASALPSGFHSVCYQVLNARTPAPFLVAVTRSARKTNRDGPESAQCPLGSPSQ